MKKVTILVEGDISASDLLDYFCDLATNMGYDLESICDNRIVVDENAISVEYVEDAS